MIVKNVNFRMHAFTTDNNNINLFSCQKYHDGSFSTLTCSTLSNGSLYSSIAFVTLTISSLFLRHFSQIIKQNKGVFHIT